MVELTKPSLELRTSSTRFRVKTGLV